MQHTTILARMPSPHPSVWPLRVSSPVVLSQRRPHGALGFVLWTGALVTSAALQGQPVRREASDIDWVSFAALTPAQRASLPAACCGLYVPPVLPLLEGNAADLQILGGTVEASDDGIVAISGGLQARQGDSQLAAEQGRYDENSQRFTAGGGIEYRQPGLLLVGESAVVEQQLGSAEISQASYVLHEASARGRAEMIIYRDAQGIITIDNGMFTRCEPGDNAWQVAGREIDLNRSTGMGTAIDVTLRVRDVPVLYLPWVRFPLDERRTTGLLAPVIGSTRDGGLDVAVPYYLNLAPHYDLTFTPRVQTERGVMLGLESRFLGTRWQQDVLLNALPGDRLYDEARKNEPTSESPPVPDRWALDYGLAARLGRGWTGVIDYNAVSDEDYFQDFGNDGLNSTTQSFLSRSAALSYRSRQLAFTASSQDIQLIDPSVSPLNQPYRTLPRLTLDSSRTLGAGLELGVNAEWVRFDRSVNPARFSAEQRSSGALVTGSRLAVTPQLRLPWENSYAFFTPTLRYKYASWQLDDPAVGTDAAPSRGIVSANLDSGLIFERETVLAGSRFRQTLEPRLYYLYNEYEDQSGIPLFDTSDLTFSFNQLFRDDRFSGRDRVGDANQFTLALSSRLYDARGQERARFSAGQIRHLRDRRVLLQGLPGPEQQRNSSALTGEFFYQVATRWRVGSYVEWDPRDRSLDVGNAQLQYQRDSNHLLNVAYRYRDLPPPVFVNGFDRRIKQTDVSGLWPLASRWNLVARWNYDHSNDRTLEGIAGLEYSTCCWNLRVIGRRWIDNDALFFGIEDNNSGVFVQFELKGLGSILGGNVSSMLNNGIRGFQDRENGRF